MPSAIAKAGIPNHSINAITPSYNRKNLPRLIEAFARVKRAHPIPHKLVLAGRDRWGAEMVYAAVYVDPYDVDNVAAGLWRAIDDGLLRTALIARGQLRARSFSWQQMAERTLNFYRDAAQAGR
jgi:glycosyltransferase involved in cell wall biosynthesis